MINQTISEREIDRRMKPKGELAVRVCSSRDLETYSQFCRGTMLLFLISRLFWIQIGSLASARESNDDSNTNHQRENANLLARLQSSCTSSSSLKTGATDALLFLILWRLCKHRVEAMKQQLFIILNLELKNRNLKYERRRNWLNKNDEQGRKCSGDYRRE